MHWSQTKTRASIRAYTVWSSAGFGNYVRCREGALWQDRLADNSDDESVLSGQMCSETISTVSTLNNTLIDR